MASKRMFSKEITGSDAFLDMPSSTQSLYFHLGMEADDDGFIGNPKKVMRVLGASDDDLKILLTKRFLLSFSSGVVVVKHHRINNNWDSYNCKRTVYLEEFTQLNIKENKAYTLDKLQGIPVQSEHRLKPVVRIEENRIEIPAKADFIIPHEERKKKPSKGRDKLAQALTYRCYEKMEDAYGIPPTDTFLDYLRVLEAQKVLKDSDILLMVEDALAVGKAKTLREMLTSREIDIYRQQNV